MFLTSRSIWFALLTKSLMRSLLSRIRASIWCCVRGGVRCSCCGAVRSILRSGLYRGRSIGDDAALGRKDDLSGRVGMGLSGGGLCCLMVSG